MIVVVYFDQLLGATPTQKIVERLLFYVFNLFCWFLVIFYPKTRNINRKTDFFGLHFKAVILFKRCFPKFKTPFKYHSKYSYAIKPVLSSQTSIRPIHNPTLENIDTAAGTSYDIRSILITLLRSYVYVNNIFKSDCGLLCISTSFRVLRAPKSW